MRSFIVAAWAHQRHRERKLRRVEAETAEEAVVMMAAARPEPQRTAVYEAWPEGEPATNLRIVFAPPSPQMSLPALA